MRNSSRKSARRTSGCNTPEGNLDSDSRLAAGAASALQRIAPDVGGMGPLGFVQLVMRQNLESTDLRYEALNLVEAGMINGNKGAVKVLANGDIASAVTVKGLKVSAGARQKIEAAGGRVEE